LRREVLSGGKPQGRPNTQGGQRFHHALAQGGLTGDESAVTLLERGSQDFGSTGGLGCSFSHSLLQMVAQHLAEAHGACFFVCAPQDDILGSQGEARNSKAKAMVQGSSGLSVRIRNWRVETCKDSGIVYENWRICVSVFAGLK
jgi:hypothetical protein